MTDDRPYGSFPPPWWLAPGLTVARRYGHRAAIRAVLKPLRVAARRYRRPIDRDVLGFNMRLHHYASLHQAWLLFYPTRVDPRCIGFVRQQLRPGDVFVDAGAHAGFYALVAAQTVGPAGRVLAIEADPDVFAELRCNLHFNAAANVCPVHGALWEVAQTVTLRVDVRNRGSSRVDQAAAGAVAVPAFPLDALLREHDVRALGGAKLDIEGCEYAVLRRFFADADRSLYPRFLVVEINPGFPDANATRDLLARVGYQTAFTEYLNYAMVLTG